MTLSGDKNFIAVLSKTVNTHPVYHQELMSGANIVADIWEISGYSKETILFRNTLAAEGGRKILAFVP